MPEFDYDAALASPAPYRNRTGQCACGIPKDFDKAYCPGCLHARCAPVRQAYRHLLNNGVQDMAGVDQFAVWIWSRLALGFHPESDIADYVNGATGEASLQGQDAVNATEWLRQCWEVADQEGVDLCEAVTVAQEDYLLRVLRQAGKNPAGMDLAQMYFALCEIGDPQGPPAD